ncbi:MAG: 50S ribosomal protein L2, partial [Nitrososphaerales archaeon]
MGKRILAQRRGKGGLQWRAPKKGKVSQARYPPIKAETIKGYVSDILHERGRNAPLARIDLENGGFFYTVAVQGLSKGATIEIGSSVK